MKRIRIVLADAHVVLRSGLKALLEQEDDLIVVGEAADGVTCVEQVLALTPDIVILGISMPRSDGFETLEQIRMKAPETRVLILTMYDSVGYLRRVLALGGTGYVPKRATADELLTAVHTVYDGGVYLHPDFTWVLTGPDGNLSNTNHPLQNTTRMRYDTLSKHEAEIFRLVAMGYHNTEIAELVHLSVRTIEHHKSRFMQKLDVHSRAGVVRCAIELGILQ
ncbi:oxygen regulatory protein NreC [bacterium BMS3Bbin02]|nr:oxygen regulatory protein NreC [bacterium BMS3Bbin02]